MTEYAQADLAEARRLAPELSSKAQERIARALASRGMRERPVCQECNARRPGAQCIECGKVFRAGAVMDHG